MMNGLLSFSVILGGIVPCSALSIRASQGKSGFCNPHVGLCYANRATGYVSAGHWIHALSVDLTPPRYPSIPFTCPNKTKGFAMTICKALTVQLQECDDAIDRIQQVAQESISTSLRGLRSRRSLTDLIGDVGNFFGIASVKQVKLLAAALTETSGATSSNTRAIKGLADAFVSLQDASRQEMDTRDLMIQSSLSRITRLVHQLKVSLTQVDRKILQGVQANQYAILLLAKALPALMQLTMQLQATATWYESFNDAVSASLHGDLSPRLIPPPQLSRIMAAIDQRVQSHHK